jgi:mannonate dehydratase
MKMTLRWYPGKDAVNLAYIRQIPGVTGVVSELQKPVGAVWPVDEIEGLRSYINQHGLAFEVVESVKLHEDIKLGADRRDQYIESFIETIKNLGKSGVKVVCYDFMPIFDWFRTDLTKVLPDGSTTMAYSMIEASQIDPLSSDIKMADWETDYSREELETLFGAYREKDTEDMWKNLQYFLDAVIPYAEQSDVKLGMHPDDPCWPIFGLPRIITNEANIDRLLSLYDSPYNSLTLCSGSLGCSAAHDVAALVGKYAGMDRIAFGHMRNVKLFQDGSFDESAHLSTEGSLDMVQIMKAYHDAGFTGYIRPDHGRVIWGETGAIGYGLYDRALGAMYLNGIWETLEKLD